MWLGTTSHVQYGCSCRGERFDGDRQFIDGLGGRQRAFDEIRRRNGRRELFEFLWDEWWRGRKRKMSVSVR
jgi:hypothetical protein